MSSTGKWSVGVQDATSELTDTGLLRIFSSSLREMSDDDDVDRGDHIQSLDQLVDGSMTFQVVLVSQL